MSHLISLEIMQTPHYSGSTELVRLESQYCLQTIIVSFAN